VNGGAVIPGRRAREVEGILLGKAAKNQCGSQPVRWVELKVASGPTAAVLDCPVNVGCWPIATGDILTARRRFRGIADMDRFSSRSDL